MRSEMIFIIEHMLIEGNSDCIEWMSGRWTVVTRDGERDMVIITYNWCEVLTLPE